MHMGHKETVKKIGGYTRENEQCKELHDQDLKGSSANVSLTTEQA